MHRFFLSVALLLSLSSMAQSPAAKQLPAKRKIANIKLDGELDEAAWKVAVPATNFVEWRPAAGTQEEPANKTVVYFLYDNASVYMGGYCYERTRDSISREVVRRDDGWVSMILWECFSIPIMTKSTPLVFM